MSAPSTSTAIPTISVESLHPGQKAQVEGAQLEMGHGKMNVGAKGFLMKKMAAGGSSFCSPTDTMVSPCTQKLAASKKRHYTKGKPLSLSSSFQSAQGGSQLVPGSKPSSLSQSTSAGSENQPLDF